MHLFRDIGETNHIVTNSNMIELSQSLKKILYMYINVSCTYDFRRVVLCANRPSSKCAQAAISHFIKQRRLERQP